MSRWVIGLALLAATCGSCLPTGRASLVPMAWRPDTRHIVVLHVDSIALFGTLAILQQALPNEGSVCYWGRLYDSTIADVAVKVMALDSVAPAQHDSADRWHVYYSVRDAGCPDGVLAAGHSHPYTPPDYPCANSDQDTSLLFGNPDLLASIVWCGDGRAEILYQDGRRGQTRWRS